MAYKFQVDDAALSGNLTLNGPFDLLFGTDSESTIGTTGNRPATIWADNLRATTLYGDGSNLTGLSAGAVTGSDENLSMMLVFTQTASASGVALGVGTSDGSTNPTKATLTFNPSSGLLSGSGAINAASISLQNGAISEAGVITAASVDVSGKIDGATGVDVAGTNIVDSSRNLVNIGSVGCGAVTSTGAVVGTSISGSGVAGAASLLMGDTGAKIGVASADDAITIASNGNVTIDSSVKLIATEVSGTDGLWAFEDSVGVFLSNMCTFTLSGGVGANFNPKDSNEIDLGGSTAQWKDLYVDGIAYIDQIGTDSDPLTGYFNGGEIDGVTIGSEAACTIDNTVIGGSTAVAGSFTTLSATANAVLGNSVTVDLVSVSGAVSYDSGVRFSGMDVVTHDDCPLTATSSYVVMNAGEAGTCTLPENPVHGDWVAIKRSAQMAYAVEITGTNDPGYTIDNETEISLDSAGSAVTLIFNSTEHGWMVF